MPRYGEFRSVTRMFPSSKSPSTPHHMDVLSPIDRSGFANTVSQAHSLARMTSRINDSDVIYDAEV